MSLPYWVLTLGLVFWGACVGVWPLAVLMAGGIWLAKLVDRKVAFSTSEVSRALDVCWLLVFGGLLLTYSREPVGSVVRSFGRWLPLVFFPALMVQVWSESRLLPMAALLPLPWWRRRDHGGARIDVAGPFLVFCLLSASVASGGVGWFYPGLMVVAGLALWVSRVPGYSKIRAGVFLGGVMLGGWFVGLGLSGLQSWFESSVLTWVTQWRRDDSAYRSTRTSIGASGDVGGSGRVVLTVRSEHEGKVPLRLRSAVFSVWSDGSWYAPSSNFEKVEGNGGDWTLDPNRGMAGAVRIEMRTEATGGLLAIPGDAHVIGDCPAESVERTRLGVVRVGGGAGMLPYRVDFGPGTAWEMEPTEESQEIKATERPVIEAVALELGLRGRSAREAADRIAAHFEDHFRYTTELKPSSREDPRVRTPLGRFLLLDREGHCEYFATAAVLLLRTAGIPARYVTGFLVNPQEQEGGVYWVRARHAHAWVRIWMEGRWQDFDPTPPTLADALPKVSRWDRWWSGMWFSLTRWWYLGEKRWLREAYWLVLPLLALTIWRFRRLRVARPDRGGGAGDDLLRRWPGWDSEWFEIEATLAERGWSRGARAR